MASPWFVVVYNQHTMNQFHERFLAAYSSNFRPCTQGTLRKKFLMLTTGDCPKLIWCRSKAPSVSLVFAVVTHTDQSTLIYIEPDLDPTERIVRMTCGSPLSSSMVIR